MFSKLNIASAFMAALLTTQTLAAPVDAELVKRTDVEYDIYGYCDLQIIYGSMWEIFPTPPSTPAEMFVVSTWQGRGSRNLNDGFNGSTPSYLTYKKGKQCIERYIGGVKFSQQITKNNNWRDFALNAGGNYRYINPLPYTRGVNDKVTGLLLLETDEELIGIPGDIEPQMHGMTSNLNSGRGGRYLYVLWSTTQYAVEK